MGPAHTKIGNLRLALESLDGKAYTLKPYDAEPGGALTTYGVDATGAVANGTGSSSSPTALTGSTGDFKGWSLGFWSMRTGRRGPSRTPPTRTWSCGPRLTA